MTKKFKWNKEMERFLLNETEGLYHYEIAEKFTQKFGMYITKTQVKDRLKKLGYKPRGEGTRGVKYGTESKLKGRKRTIITENMRKAMFQKGHSGHARPIGSERIDNDGYVMIKVGHPKKWRLKSHVVWEQYHGRKMKENEIIAYLDRNRSNCSIENLKIVEIGEIPSLVRRKMYFANAKLTESAINLIRLEKKIKEIENKK